MRRAMVLSHMVSTETGRIARLCKLQAILVLPRMAKTRVIKMVEDAELKHWIPR